tara:strand:+ start:15 stop:173 length:159 start_codon:yes stop_codon:yes gene_type:complete
MYDVNEMLIFSILVILMGFISKKMKIGSDKLVALIALILGILVWLMPNFIAT